MLAELISPPAANIVRKMKKKQVDTVDKTLFLTMKPKQKEMSIHYLWFGPDGVGYRDFKPKDQVLSLLKYQQERGIYLVEKNLSYVLLRVRNLQIWTG